ncbi:ribulose phosphate epimerase [Rhodobacteraceae bacterium 4F10]|uniref:GFA family protein n=1 Tax=Shimia thalassica TaxID=1715693 RepID=UPI000C06D29F|nr:ribulose phosphate epimerase [Rhodobacteraceae bacterium 4F10]
MPSTTDYAGGCLCGAIRFEAKTPISNPHSCSCKMCQRHSGALTSVWIEFPKDSVIWNGPHGEPATYRSSDISSRVFCANCGSTLGAIDDGPVVALLLGAFDNADDKAFIPRSHSYSDSSPGWWRTEINDE